MKKTNITAVQLSTRFIEKTKTTTEDRQSFLGEYSSKVSRLTKQCSCFLDKSRLVNTRQLGLTGLRRTIALRTVSYEKFWKAQDVSMFQRNGVYTQKKKKFFIPIFLIKNEFW